MKKIINLLAVTIIVTLFASCSKDVTTPIENKQTTVNTIQFVDSSTVANGLFTIKEVGIPVSLASVPTASAQTGNIAVNNYMNMQILVSPNVTSTRFGVFVYENNNLIYGNYLPTGEINFKANVGNAYKIVFK